jgi:outer membrane usher protein
MEKPANTRSRACADRVLLALAALVCGYAPMAAADNPGLSRSIADVPLVAPAQPHSRLYFLEAIVNGQPRNLIVTCEERSDGWWIQRAHLAALGLRVDDLSADAQGWVSIAAVSGLSGNYEAATQRLQLTVLASRHNLHVLRHAPTARDGDSAAGALVNYDALVEQQDDVSTVRAFTEERAFGDWGVFSHSGTLTAHGDERDYLRLETFWTYSDPNTLRSVTAGDLISRSLAWSRSVRLAGVQVHRNFALRPDLVTYPVTGFSGEAAVPSTVDLYVNQVRQITGTLPPGPFRVETPPAINGAGQATLVVRDILGRETVQTLDLYVVPQLLAEGLHDYSVEAGVLRENFGSRSNRYRGGLAGSASVRYGMNDRVTLESHAECASGLTLLGVGVLWQIGLIGRVNASLSVNEADGVGEQVSFGYQFVSSRFNVTADWQHAAVNYRDLPSLLGDPPARQQMRVFTGLQLSPRRHLSASYLVTDGAQRDVAGQVTRSRLASVGYNQTLGDHATVFVSAFRDFERENGAGIYLGYSMALGRSVQLHSQYESAEERSSITLTGRSPYENGWDWTFGGSRADDSLVRAAMRLTGDRGAIGADFVRHDGAERLQLGGRGTLVVAGNRLIAGRYVQDEFALVSTNGLAGVPVLHENRPAGRTDGAGFLLLPNINAYQANRVAINPLDLPFGYRLDAPERTATPRLAAGTLVRFPIEKPRAAVLVLVDANGKPLTAGSPGEILGQGDTFVVGYDGVVYLTGLHDNNRLRVQTAVGSCEVEFAYDSEAVVQADLGRVICRRSP